MSINGLEEILDEAFRSSTKNKRVIEILKDNARTLFLEDLFEITKVFVFRNKPELKENFDLKKFMENYPDNFFQKVLEGFCTALAQISEEDILEEEIEDIKQILTKKVVKNNE